MHFLQVWKKNCIYLIQTMKTTQCLLYFLDTIHCDGYNIDQYILPLIHNLEQFVTCTQDLKKYIPTNEQALEFRNAHVHKI